MGYGASKCAACGKRTSVPGYRYNGSIRYLCKRDVCMAMRASGSICGTCGVKVWSSIPYCDICDSKAGFKRAHAAAKSATAGGRKVSTEGKSACGQTPDSGSIPDCSTDDNELLVAYEDMADRLENAESRIQQMEDELLTLQIMLREIQNNPMHTVSIPDYQWNPEPYKYNGGITYRPGT